MNSSLRTRKKSRKSGGRAERIALRQASEKLHKPAAPGQRGGHYRPLSDSDINKVLDTAYKILEEIGMAEVPKVVEERALEEGCTLNSLGRLSFSRSFVEDIIAGACKRFTLHGRDP